MRKKLREIMDKEEGFTLVELLAVIVILGIIVAIAIPSIGNVINKAEKGATEADKELVIDAAKLYVVTEQNGKLKPTVGSDAQVITATNLAEAGYLDYDVDGEDGKGKPEITVTITKKDGVDADSKVLEYKATTAATDKK